jgi:hypothetical protein
MSVCVVIRCVEEALALKAFGLRVAGALHEPLESLREEMPDES